MDSHPFADLFPMMGERDATLLRESLKAHGYRKQDGLVLLYEGKILDGRNRWKTCEALGIEAPSEEYRGSGDEALKLVISRNRDRRHLDESQLAMVAARLANLFRGGNGGKHIRESQNKQSNSLLTKSDTHMRVSQEDAAKRFGIGMTSVQAGRVVLEKGSPALVRAVEQGRVTVTAARALVVLPDRDQLTIANEKDEGERRKLIKSAKERASREPKPEPAQVAEDLKLTSRVAKAAKTYWTVDEWEALSKEARREVIDRGFKADGQGMNQQTGTSIEWARWSHNTVTGCLHNCPYCYARDIAESKYPKALGFKPAFHPARLGSPGAVAIPSEASRDQSYRNIFANSMSDLFGQWVPADWVQATIEMARLNPKWNFLTLTKFPQRAAEFEFPKNWWMGTTVDAQSRVENAEKAFAKIKCGTKWLSLEPLLEPLTFKKLDLFQWIVIGGASASARTPAWHPPTRWVAHLLMQAEDHGIKVYQKTNLWDDSVRLREFPWVDARERSLPKAFRYLKGM